MSQEWQGAIAYVLVGGLILANLVALLLCTAVDGKLRVVRETKEANRCWEGAHEQRKEVDP